MKTHLTESDFKKLEQVREAENNRILSCYKIEKAEAGSSIETQEPDDFKHHRLMAGYHSVKANELMQEALELSASTKPELHAIAKEKRGESARHQRATEEHREKAKSTFDVAKHGEWNDTIPTHEQVLKYGSKQAKLADKKADEIEKEEDVKKEDVKEVKKGDSEDLEKSDHISHKWLKKNDGKYTYTSESKNDYNIHESLPESAKRDLTRKDHNQLAEIHRTVRDKIGKDSEHYIHHMTHAMIHSAMAQDSNINNEILGKLAGGQIVRKDPKHDDHDAFTPAQHLEAAKMYGNNEGAVNTHEYAAKIKTLQSKQLSKSNAFEALGVK